MTILKDSTSNADAVRVGEMISAGDVRIDLTPGSVRGERERPCRGGPQAAGGDHFPAPIIISERSAMIS